MLVKPSIDLVTPNDCRCECKRMPSVLEMTGWVRGVPGCVRGVMGDIRGSAAPLTLMTEGFFGRLMPLSLASLGLGLVRLEALVDPVTVALLPTFGAGGNASDNISSIGRGRRACAIANGLEWCCSQGAATLAKIKLESTVVGSTFSCMRPLR